MSRVTIQQTNNVVEITRPRPHVHTPEQVNAVVEVVVEQTASDNAGPCCAPTRVVEVITPGPAGPPGETEGATFLAVAGETMHGRRIVRIVAGLLYHPSLSAPAHAGQCIGLVLQSGNAGDEYLVRTGGQHTEPSWNWSPGSVWCGEGGVMTQAPIPSGWVLKVGTAINATTVEIDIDDPILRS